MIIKGDRVQMGKPRRIPNNTMTYFVGDHIDYALFKKKINPNAIWIKKAGHLKGVTGRVIKVAGSIIDPELEYELNTRHIQGIVDLEFIRVEKLLKGGL